MKKFLSGFVAGAILFSAIGVFAATYVAHPCGFKVLVNGEEFVSDPPALVVEGRTYLPLRAMGDALGIPVDWNDELGQAEVGDKKYYKTEQVGQGKYGTYEGTTIIDFGKFLSIEPTEVDDDGEVITYIYSMDNIENSDEDYINYLKESKNIGYEFKETESTFYATMYEVANYNGLNLKPFVFTIGISKPGNDLGEYMAISFVKP